MKLYIGTKVLMAEPMMREAYNNYREWPLLANENGEDEGYLVEYTDGKKANHVAHQGYVSWLPKEQFENAYQSFDMMNFGHALECLKHLKKVARAGWNGKGMWLTLSPGGIVAAEKLWAPNNAAFAATQEGDQVEVLPYITMKTADNKIVPWLASQTDLLANDWGVVE